MPGRHTMPASTTTPPPPASGPGVARGRGSYLIGPGDLSLGWLLLYAGTLLMQLFCAAFRAWVICYPVLWVAFKLIGQPTTLVYYLAFAVGFGPLLLSLATLILPLGGWFWEQQIVHAHRQSASSSSTRTRWRPSNTKTPGCARRCAGASLTPTLPTPPCTRTR